MKLVMRADQLPEADTKVPSQGTPQDEPEVLGSGPKLAPLMARLILVVVLVGLDLVAIVRLLESASGATLAVGAMILISNLCLQVFYFSRPALPPKGSLSFLALGVQAGLAYVPFIAFGQTWLGQPGFLAGSILLTLVSPLSWIAFSLVAASVGLIEQLLTGGFATVLYGSVTTVISGLVIYGLTRLAGMVIELQRAREELASLAVANERLRFARDLHDILGHSLSAITLKTELSRGFIGDQPARAREELTSVLAISRQALADLRSVASGYRELSLEAEARSARSMLVAASVDVELDVQYGNISPSVRSVMAMVLREGVTNVLRHSKAEQCKISIREADGRMGLMVTNDGVQADEDRGAGGGAGLENLAVRVSKVGGTLTAGIDSDGRFRLEASAPAMFD